MGNLQRIVAALLLAGSTLFAQTKPGQVEANKKIVHDFYRFVWEPADDQALMKWLPQNYVEHNPRFRNGRADLANLLRNRRKGQVSILQQKHTEFPLPTRGTEARFRS